MRYAVTGATGFVGGVLARQLREAGHEVVALVRNPARAESLDALGIELVTGDLDDDAALDRLCRNADGLFHVAGWYKLGDRHPEQGRRVNVEGTANILTAARRSDVPRVVYTSTLAVNSDTRGQVVDESYHFNGRHLSVYDKTKAAAHDLATAQARAGLPVVIVQPGLVYGPGDTSQTGALAVAVLDGKRPLVPSGGAVCWGHVDDVARGHALAMDRGGVGESYFLAGERRSLSSVLRRLAGLAGTRGPIVLPDLAVRGSAGLAGLAGRLVPVPADYAAETLRAGLATYLGLPAKAERDLGWSSRPLDEGLRELVVTSRPAA
jgi:nucleoside-diphosphate-sugar epimerase